MTNLNKSKTPNNKTMDDFWLKMPRLIDRDRHGWYDSRFLTCVAIWTGPVMLTIVLPMLIVLLVFLFGGDPTKMMVYMGSHFTIDILRWSIWYMILTPFALAYYIYRQKKALKRQYGDT